MSFIEKFKKGIGAEKKLKIFFGSDLHGSTRTFKKFINAYEVYGVDTLIMGGDIIGKVTVPIINEGMNKYRTRLMGKTEHLSGRVELNDLIERMHTLGFYYKVMDEDEFKYISSNEERTEELFYVLALDRLRSWIQLADEKLKNSGVKMYMMGGNDDYSEMLKTIELEQTDNIVYCENKVINIDDQHKMISVGYSNITPWETPRELPEDEMAKIIEEKVKCLSDEEIVNSIFNFHVPPQDSTLDTCPMLDYKTRPPSLITKGGQPVMYGAGSKAVRQSLENYQPILSLHGHIHESAAVTKIGKTVSINPGSEYSEGIIKGAIITLGTNKVKSVQLTSG